MHMGLCDSDQNWTKIDDEVISDTLEIGTADEQPELSEKKAMLLALVAYFSVFLKSGHHVSTGTSFKGVEHKLADATRKLLGVATDARGDYLCRIENTEELTNVVYTACHVVSDKDIMLLIAGSSKFIGKAALLRATPHAPGQNFQVHLSAVAALKALSFSGLFRFADREVDAGVRQKVTAYIARVESLAPTAYMYADYAEYLYGEKAEVPSDLDMALADLLPYLGCLSDVVPNATYLRSVSLKKKSQDASGNNPIASLLTGAYFAAVTSVIRDGVTDQGKKGRLFLDG